MGFRVLWHWLDTHMEIQVHCPFTFHTWLEHTTDLSFSLCLRSPTSCPSPLPRRIHTTRSGNSFLSFSCMKLRMVGLNSNLLVFFRVEPPLGSIHGFGCGSEIYQTIFLSLFLILFRNHENMEKFRILMNILKSVLWSDIWVCKLQSNFA